VGKSEILVGVRHASRARGAPSGGHDARARPRARRRCIWSSQSGLELILVEREPGRTDRHGRGDVVCTSSTQDGGASHARVQVRAAALQKYERTQFPEGQPARDRRDAPRDERVALANGRARRAACGVRQRGAERGAQRCCGCNKGKTAKSGSVTSSGTEAGASADGEARGGRVQKERSVTGPGPDLSPSVARHRNL
jgi:hypothetical protein